MTSERPQEPTVRPWLERDPCCERRRPLIEIRQLAVSYHGKLALRDLSLDIASGCITAVVGPSGCGKSTLLACLNRLNDLVPGCRVDGSVRLDGLEVTGANTDVVALRRRVGMIFQKPSPFPLSIRDNLTFPLEFHGVRSRVEREHRTEVALRQVGLWQEVADRLTRPALELSGGQQQRLCLARALVLEPEVILLDEPCSALDPIASGVVEDLIASLRARFTVVIVTHNLSQARRVADDVALLWLIEGAGQLVEVGAAQQVFETPSNQLTADYVRGVRG